MKILYFSVFLLVVLSACTVSPWERGNLAKQEMSITPNPQQAALMEHAFESKEASSGGMMGSGGGCGCN
ncbi:MAG: DUF4266 domain-containing protein [Methylococcales bacterium]